MKKELLKFIGWKLFIVLSVLYALLGYSINFLFLNDGLYYQSFGEQLAIERIDEILDFSQKWQWFSYIFLPIIVLFRVFYTAVFIYIGVFFTELKIEFGKLFKVVMLADFVYVLAVFARLIILIFFKEISTLDDLQFQPFSMMELLDKNTVDPFFVYPLSLLNVFELGYFLVLGWLLVTVLNEVNEEHPTRFWKSLKLVTISYGSGLLLWILLIMFLTLNMS